MGSDFGGWEIIEEIGGGGQGVVYKVRKPAAAKIRREAQEKLVHLLRSLAGGVDSDPAPPDFLNDTQARVALTNQNFISAVKTLVTPDNTADLGALKHFRIAGAGAETNKARQRFDNEVRVLEHLNEPGIVKLHACDSHGPWMVTEYHSGGTLADHPERFRGDARAAMEAFLPLVRAVAAVHNAGAVHRDIKLRNIFLASDGRLVLGDFGIAFFRDQEGQRLTDTFERAGSRDWMPPWAHTGRRLEDVAPSFDVFTLGKVLWAMVAGEQMLPFWYHRRDEYNLEHRFPNDPGMPVVNSVLDRCIVEHEATCLPSAGDLLSLVDERLRMLRYGGTILDDTVKRLCCVCGRGQYAPLAGRPIDRMLVAVDKTAIHRILNAVALYDPTSGQAYTVRLYTCTVCGHFQFFHFADSLRPNGWERPAGG